jgi:hypothetical protein
MLIASSEIEDDENDFYIRGDAYFTLEVCASRPSQEQFMKFFTTASLAAALLVGAITFVHARPAAASDLEQRVTDLEAQVALLLEHNRDLRAKLKIEMSAALRNFFNAPEMWECTYDSGWADCATVCRENATDRFNACMARHPEGQSRVDCINDSTSRTQSCLSNCPTPTLPSNPFGC